MKAQQGATYTMTQVDTAFDMKANLVTTYTITQADKYLAKNTHVSYVPYPLVHTCTRRMYMSLYAVKANQSITYAIMQVGNALDLNEFPATTYTKTELESAVALKTNRALTYTQTCRLPSISNSYNNMCP